MATKNINTRLLNLDRNVDLALGLVRDLEEELFYETDPIKRAKYERDKKRVVETLEGHRKEIETLERLSVADKSAGTEVTSQIKSINEKLDSLQSGHEELSHELASLKAQVLQGLGANYGESLEPVVRSLGAANLRAAQTAIERVDSTDLDEREAGEILEAVKTAANHLVKTDLIKEPSLRANISKLAGAIEDSKLELKHRLKMSIPLIPFLLSYEAEASWNNALNLEKATKWFRTKGGRDGNDE